MLNKVDFYYFSPTGGTKKAGSILANELSQSVNEIDLAGKTVSDPYSELIVVAAPVFSGRLPSLVTDKLAQLNGMGKKAVTAVVYGVRAYEDALLELNDTITNRGFEVIASAALVAQHSIVPEVGFGRPDQEDAFEIRSFAKRILDAAAGSSSNAVVVPGNYPYKEVKKGSSTPISTSECNVCGRCVEICPTDAIIVEGRAVATDICKCIMCMACTASCPTAARVLPCELQSALTERLSPFKDIRRENEFYL